MLGWEGTPVGSVEIRDFGSPATAVISDSTRETLPGDRLIKPLDDSFNANFYPHVPDHEVGGRILSVYDGVSQIGQYQVVTLNRGTREGRSEEHTSELQSLMRISYAVFCLKKKI